MVVMVSACGDDGERVAMMACGDGERVMVMMVRCDGDDGERVW